MTTGDDIQTFDNLFDKLLLQLKTKNNIGELSKKFGQSTTNKQRVGFILGLGDVLDCLNVKSTTDLKCSQRAEENRTRGNTAFSAKKYLESVRWYTESVSWSDMSGSTLSLAHANRSAALFHLGQHEESLVDIGLALSGQYPTKLAYKLYERKARNLHQLGNTEEALFNVGLCEDALDASELSVTQKNKWKSNLVQLRKEITQPSQVKNHRKIINKDSLNDSVGFPSGCNAVYPSLSSACEVVHTPSQGRFIQATRDIEPGEVILREKPFASVVLPEVGSTHCHHCFKYTLCGVPCTQCHSALFCGSACREAAVPYHQYECGILAQIYSADVGKFGILAMRAVVVQPVDCLLHLTDDDDDLSRAGLNDTGQYLPDDYLAIHSLVGHAKDRSVADLFRRSVLAVFLTRCLEEQTSYFASPPLGVDHSQAVLTVASLLLRHIMSFPCNAHEISELALQPTSVVNSESVEVGAGIYSTLSLFNHSCDPNVNRNFYGDTCVVRAIGVIRRGEEVADNYGAVYAMQSREQRATRLEPQYYFTCQCAACREDWPLYSLLKQDHPMWRCSSCSACLQATPTTQNTPTQVTTTTNVTCAACQSSQDLASRRAKLAASRLVFQEAFEALVGLNVKRALPSLLSHLALLEHSVEHPWREINDCQEAVKMCFSTMGNCVDYVAESNIHGAIL